MEAGGAASDIAGGSQYGFQHEDLLWTTGKECEVVEMIDNIGISKGVDECYDVWSSKEADETMTTVDGGQEENNVGMSKGVDECNDETMTSVDGVSRGVSFKKGPWTKAEDEVLMRVVHELGSNDWVKIEMQSGLNRTSKSCRLRWKNHLQPHLKKGTFSFKEENDVIRMHYKYGNKWSLMAKRIPGRSDNEIKNFWHSRIKKCKKRGLPLYPDWCREDDQTLNDDDLCRKTNVETIAVPNATYQAQVSLLGHSHSLLPNYDMFQYYPASTSETSMINGSGFIKLPETQFCLDEEGGQTALHHASSLHGSNPFNQSPQVPLSPMDFSPHKLYPSFQHFLSPRPKTSQSTFTFSTPISSSPHQLPSPHGSCCSSPQLPFNNSPRDNPVRDPKASVFESSKCPPILSLPSGRFKRSHGATHELPPVVKLNEAPNSYQRQRISNTAATVSSFNMTALTYPSSSPNLSNMHSPISPLSLSKSSKISMLPTNQSNRSTMTAATSHPLYQNEPLHSFGLKSFSSSPNLQLESLALPSLEQHANVYSTTNGSPCGTWKPSTSESLLFSPQFNSSSLEPPSIESNTEPPSIESNTGEFLPTPEANFYSNECISENNTDLLDTLLQDAQEDSCLSDLGLVEEYLFSQQLNTQKLYEKILRRKQYKNITIDKGISSKSNLSREAYSNGSLKSMELLGKGQQGEVENTTSTYTQEVKENYLNNEVQGREGSTADKSSQWELSKNGCSSNMEDLLHGDIEMIAPCTNFINQDLVITSNDKHTPCETSEADDPLREQRKRNLKGKDQRFMTKSSMPKDLMLKNNPSGSLPREPLKRNRTVAKCENYSSIEDIEKDQTPQELVMNSAQHVSLSGELGHQNEAYHTESDSWNGILNSTKYSEGDCFIKNIEAYEGTIANNNDLGDATTETLILDSQDLLHGSSLCYPYCLDLRDQCSSGFLN
ncbi:hypothetical protein Leryth_005918 [Lithospermum erythrorhizon]|nr:hypothetical protein Leryth_005918 [Lithospermum erythrorhizon]